MTKECIAVGLEGSVMAPWPSLHWHMIVVTMQTVTRKLVTLSK